MFKLFKQIAKLETAVQVMGVNADNMAPRLTALEEYLGIEFFNGPTQKPHYRKLRVVKKKLGRPKKVTK